MTVNDRRVAAALADEAARLTARSLGEAAVGQALRRHGLGGEADRRCVEAAAYADAADAVRAAIPRPPPRPHDVLAEAASKAPLAAEATTMLRTARATYISAERRDAAAGQLVRLLAGSDDFVETTPKLRELLVETSKTLRGLDDVASALEGIGCADEASWVRVADDYERGGFDASEMLVNASRSVLARSWPGGAAQAEAERCVADLERLLRRREEEAML